MLLFPNAKINLGLQVTAKRPDGYHDIATVFYPLPVTDMLEVIPASDFSFTQSGLPVDGAPEKNLCYKAWTLLRDACQLPPIALHLHKQIPLGAGLGGGSSDAAFTLQLLNKVFQLQLSEQQLSDYALQLGSDCPFFLLNKPAYATGRGERLTPVDIPHLNGKKILLLNPGIHISTAWAFAQVQPAAPAVHLPDMVQAPVAEWKNRLPNDFTAPVFAAHSGLKKLLDWLYAAGALFAGMTGTGATLFGIFDEWPAANTLPDNCRHWQVAL
ncbi:MAG: 4-(cytidine 5'-diphospho)-2-C-methyl-D-erythritol kinase [Flavihumibacter sp.]